MGGATTGITPQESLPSVPSLPSTMFQSNIDGISVGVSNGWVYGDLNNTDPTLRQTEQSYGAGVLVELCPQTKQPLSYFPTERLEPCTGKGAEYGER
jgi:hypothetical protein